MIAFAIRKPNEAVHRWNWFCNERENLYGSIAWTLQVYSSLCDLRCFLEVHTYFLAICRWIHYKYFARPFASTSEETFYWCTTISALLWLLENPTLWEMSEYQKRISFLYNMYRTCKQLKISCSSEYWEFERYIDWVMQSVIIFLKIYWDYVIRDSPDGLLAK